MNKKPLSWWSKSSIILFTLCCLLFQGCTSNGVGLSTEPVLENNPQTASTDVENVEEISQTEEAQPMETVVSEPAEISTGGTLYLVSQQEPDTLDPHKTAMSAAALVMSLFGGTLVHLNRNNEIIPYHSTSWTVSEDGLVYEFKLREDILFQDGTPLTAKDYVWTFQRAVDPDTASPVAGGFLVNMEQIEAIDDYTLRITLSEPKYTFIYDLASEYLQPLPQAKVEEMGDQFGRTPVGTGPYIITEWKTSNKITLVRNPDFNWAPQGYHQGPAYIDGIDIKLIPEVDTILAGLEAGEIDTSDLTVRDVQRFSESGFDIITGVYQGFGPGMLMNLEVPPFDDVRIRQALNYAINRDALLTVILEDKGTVQYGPLSPAQIGYWSGVEEIGQHYDLEKAQELIVEAGYSKNSDGIYEKDGVKLDFDVLVPSGFTEWVKVLEILESEFGKFGIKINIQSLETGSLVERDFAGDYQISMMGIGAREADILFDMFHSSNIGVGMNLSRVSNPELDELLENSRKETDGEKRQEILNEIQKIIVEEAYVIPLYAADYFTAVNPRVHDLYIVNGTSYYFDVNISK